MKEPVTLEVVARRQLRTIPAFCIVFFIALLAVLICLPAHADIDYLTRYHVVGASGNWLAIIIISATSSVSTVITIPAADKSGCDAAIHAYFKKVGAIPAQGGVSLCVDTTVETIAGDRP